jgi:ribosomal protein S17
MSVKAHLTGRVVSDKMEKTVGVGVDIAESRPLSRRKRWVVTQVVEKAAKV